MGRIFAIVAVISMLVVMASAIAIRSAEQQQVLQQVAKGIATTPIHTHSVMLFFIAALLRAEQQDAVARQQLFEEGRQQFCIFTWCIG